MDTEDPIEVRMGTFFVVIGAGLFLLFVMSDVANKVDFDYFFLGMLLMAIGFYFRRNKTPPPSSGRFTGFKSFWQKLRAGRGGGGGGGGGAAKEAPKGKDNKKDKK
ncbi:MAG: hypothetical protein JNK32_09790 [Anaerolineales bacterium]|nr:hypothetical protein [Anaerolineales bacterium]